MKDIFDSSGREQLKLMACLTIAVHSTFITLQTQLIAFIVLSSCVMLLGHAAKKMKERGREGERQEEKRKRARAIAINASIRADERNKARVIKITVAVV